ncbi:asparagine synthetase B family protein [Methylopila henanensis]|uniref:asparagine synthase (glutamine-hydrolyzing) n=1 Tax=Methylopila henanensis TaxID=873516 RepID=A0ABW4K9Y6_9HYPH
MCGLFFVVRRDGPVDPQRFERAFATMSHRGPDATLCRYGETTIDTPDGPRALWWAAGHHRLSILDLDPRSNQPFERDGALLVYNGEAYDYERLKGEAPFHGVRFDTSGDTEVVFEGLKREGPDFVARINGMWALAFADWRGGAVHLSRDRYGKKPLFWRMDKDAFCAASTIGVIDRYLGRPVRHDPGALAAFVVHGVAYPGGEQTTAHADIRQTPPSGSLTLDLAAWRMRERRHFSFDAPSGFDPAMSLTDALADALRLRLVSDRPVGLLLSGGVDSSLLLSIAHATGRADQLRCFIGDTGRSEDAQYGFEAAKALGVKPEVLDLGYGDVSFARFLKICRHQEKPFPLIGNAMAMAEMYEKVAEHGIPVVLDGTGGDEVFGGYWDRYFPFAVREAWRRRDFGWLFGVARAEPRRLKEMAAAIAGRPTDRVRPFLKTVARFDADALPSPNPLSSNDLGFDAALRADASRGRLGEWLWQNDRNAMMSSIENRSPLLDVRLTAFLGDGYRRKFSGAFNKVRLRESFDAFRRLPTQWRVQKQGFRWDRRRFLLQNREQVIDLLAASDVIDAIVDRRRFVDAIRADEASLRSTTTARLLSVAGVAEAMNAA